MIQERHIRSRALGIQRSAGIGVERLAFRDKRDEFSALATASGGRAGGVLADQLSGLAGAMSAARSAVKTTRLFRQHDTPGATRRPVRYSG